MFLHSHCLLYFIILAVSWRWHGLSSWSILKDVTKDRETVTVGKFEKVQQKRATPLNVLSGNYSACPQITYSSNFILSSAFLTASHRPFRLSSPIRLILQWLTRPEIILKCHPRLRSSKEKHLTQFSVENTSIRRGKERRRKVRAEGRDFLFVRNRPTSTLCACPSISYNEFQGNRYA